MRRLSGDEGEERDDSGDSNERRGVSAFLLNRSSDLVGYICPSKECLKKAIRNKGLERSFKQSIPTEVYEALEKEMGLLGSE